MRRRAKRSLAQRTENLAREARPIRKRRSQICPMNCHARRDQRRTLAVQGDTGQGRAVHDTAGGVNCAKRSQLWGVSSFKRDGLAKRTQFASGRNERNRWNRKELERNMYKIGRQKRSQFLGRLRRLLPSPVGAGPIGFVWHAERRALWPRRGESWFRFARSAPLLSIVRNKANSWVPAGRAEVVRGTHPTRAWGFLAWARLEIVL